MNNYTKIFSSTIKEIETIYGIRSPDDPKGERGVLEVKDLIVNLVQESSIVDLQSKQIEIMNELIVLAYTQSELEFRNVKILRFSKLPGLQEYVELIAQFTKIDTAKKARGEVSKLISLLNEIDTNFVDVRRLIVYRYLRIFIVLIILNNLTGASVIAKLILCQY